MSKWGTGLTLAMLSVTAAMSGQPEQAGEVAASVGQYVQTYYSRAQSIVAEEAVILQPLARDLSFDGFARRLVYELRLEWNPDAAADEEVATVVRELISATGPALGPPDQPDCLDPRAVSPEPLAFLLPERQNKFTFRLAGTERVEGRDAVRLDYTPVAAEPPQVQWEGECGDIDLPGRLRGRIWADAATSEILRLDERLVGMVDVPGPPGPRRPFAPLWFTVERSDTSIHYRQVRFEDPDETLLLPSRIETLSVIRNSGIPRLRSTRSFTNYRRFVTDSRIVR